MSINNLTPIEVYYYSHNSESAIKLVFGMNYADFPEINWERIRKAWTALYFLDYSGRSTAKTYDHMMSGLTKCAVLKNRRMNLFAVDRDKGIEIAEDFITPWLETEVNLKVILKKTRNVPEPRLIRSQSITKLPFKNLSLFKTYTPALRHESIKVKSDRTNMILFNEWTSWPAGSIDLMEETIEPIATRTNWYYNGTLRFRIATEKSLGIPLGKMSNELFSEIYKSKPDYQPRDWLSNNQPDDSFEKIRERFFRNFQRVWGFDYQEGIDDERLSFSEINSTEDIIGFFSDYLDGDPAVQNQIVYDSSAPKPSDASYEFIKYVWKRVKNGDPRYDFFTCSVDDIPPEFDGIIYNGSVINKAREHLLTEDFERVYGGKCVESKSQRPFSKAEINACCDNNMNVLLKRSLEWSDDDVVIFAFDAAQGTIARRMGISKKERPGTGDDAAGCVLKVGSGIPADPHDIVLIYKADDVDKEPMAYDIHQLNLSFLPTQIWLDHGGGGNDLAAYLEKDKLEIDGEEFHFVPIVHNKYVYYDGTQQNILAFISRGEPLIQEILGEMGQSVKEKYSGEDFFRNAIITTGQRILRRRGVRFPRRLEPRHRDIRRSNNRY